jgi:UPF0716 protein FxsA
VPRAVPILLLLLLVAAFVEITVLVLVGNTIGVLPTIGLLIAAGVVGTWLLRREGRRTLREFAEAARLRRPPTRELADGVLIAAGGVLIVLPGFVSDVCGILCLLPPTRAFLRRRLERAAERRSHHLQEQMMRAGRAYRDGPGPKPGGDVIDGEVVSVTEDDDDARTSGAPRRPLDQSAQEEASSDRRRE